MNQTEKLNRRVIELIHGKPWGEFKKEWYEKNINIKSSFAWNHVEETMAHNGVLKIDLSRIMQALNYNFRIYDFQTSLIFSEWKLLKDDFSTATIEDQTPETISKLLTLLK